MGLVCVILPIRLKTEYWRKGGSGLYPIVFTKYVDVLMGRGHPIEFFIEGGRSRTGKLLPPKYGLLSMVVDASLLPVIPGGQTGART